MLTNYVPQQKTTVGGKDFWNLRIQILVYVLRKGISPVTLFWGWDVSTINPTIFGRGLDS